MSETLPFPLRVVVHGEAPDPAWLAALRARVREAVVSTARDPVAALLEGEDGDVVLLRANAPLPACTFARLGAAIAASDAAVVSALTNTVPALSPAAEGAAIEASPESIDLGCWWQGTRTVWPTDAWSPECSVWRAAARALLRDRGWSGGALPDAIPGGVYDALYVGAVDVALRGPRAPADPRHPPPASPLALLRGRLAPILSTAPLHAGVDGRPVVLHVLHGWGGGVEGFVRDLALGDDAHVHLALVARGHVSRARYGEVLELALPAAGFATVGRWALPRPIDATAIHDDAYAAILSEVVSQHAVDTVVVSSLIGHALDALATGRRTIAVLHDYFPLWPVLHADFGDASQRFDRGALDAAIARGTPPFARRDANDWWALRGAWLEAIARHDVRLVAPSESVVRNVARIEPALATRGIEVVPHGLRPFARDASLVEPPARERPRILVLGRIDAGKGEALLEPVLERITGWADVWLLGAGKAAERWYGCRGVHVELDYVRDALPDAIARIAPDLALVAASVAETYSYTLSELQALHVPVVATRVGALADRITDGVDGWLVSPDADAIASMLERVARDRPALAAARKRLASAPPRALPAMVADWQRLLGLAPHALPRVRLGRVTPALLAEAMRAEHATRIEAVAEARGAALSAQRAELDARAEWAASLERLAAERERWARSLEAETVRLAELARERHEAVEAGERARVCLQHAHTARVEALEAERDAVERARAELDAQYRLVVTSRSWRLTRPLRYAARSTRAVLAAARFRLRRLLELAQRGHRSLRMRGVAGTIARLRRGLVPLAEAPVLAIPPVPQSKPDDPLPVIPGSAAPRVTIVVPVYDQFHYTRTCLAALAQHAGAVPFEVVVVDDCSSDETVEQLPRIEGIVAIRNPANLGFIGACNAGAAIARGEYLVFLNNDTAVQPGWLEALVETFERFPDCGLAGAKLVYPDGRLQEAGGIVFSDGSGWNYGRFGDPSDPAHEYVREADYCSGAAIMLRRETFDALGGFDTRYAPAYYEDTDLAFRVREAGLRCYYQPASVVVHFEGVTSGTDTASGIKRYQLVNREKFVERWSRTLASQPKPGTPIDLAREHRVRGTVLVVDAYVPEPDQDSGSVRLVNLMRLLVREGWKVVFAPDNRAYVPKYTRELQQLGVEVLYHPSYRDPVDWLRRNGARLDVAIVLRHYVMASYLPLLREYAPRARVVFDTVDLHYLREQRLGALNGDAELARAAARTKSQELRLVRECDVTLVVSPVERELLAVEAPGARVEVLSNVHEVNGARHAFAEREDLWFVGGFQHPPNVDAMQWFVREVWPRIASRLPDARFHIVGSKMPDQIRALAGERVEVHGHVPDLSPFLDRCRIAVAPLRYGAGVKGKVNQSMAHGQPVVATPIAVEGMHVVPGEDALVADSPDAFADAVVTLYGDEPLWTKLSEGGVRNVERAFSFDAAREALARILPR